MNKICFLGHAYNTEERSVVAGYDNGDIKMFDLRKMALRWETNLKNGVWWLFTIILKLSKISIGHVHRGKMCYASRTSS